MYCGQIELPFEPDEIRYLTNEYIDKSTVTYFDAGAPKQGEMYGMKKADGKDPYEIISGSMPLVTIENSFAETDKKLIIFRDSFGSSLAPLFTKAYKKITFVDTRYIQSDFVGNFVEFEGADVLFLYSTARLNNSLEMRFF